MRFMATIILILIIFCKLQAPEYHTALIAKETGMNQFEPLIKAIVWVESQNGKYTYNASENAVGWFQIRECRIDHYNRLTGSNYTLNDCYDYELSRKVFLYFAKGKDFRTASKNWNGSGPLTEIYWQKVKANL